MTRGGSILILILLLLSSIFNILPITQNVSAAESLSDWSYYRKITVNNTYIDSGLTNFPVLVVINNTVGSKCNSGDSLRFYSLNNGTRYKHDVETWGSTSYVWVRVPHLNSSGSNTSFYMYYGNNAASDVADPNGTYDSNYVLVLHFNKTGDQEDSTQYDNDATRHNSPTRTGGKVGYGFDFDPGDNDYFQIADDSSFTCNKTFTVECWFYPDSGATHTAMVNKRNTTATTVQFFLGRHSDNELTSKIDNTGYTNLYSGDGTTPKSTWHYGAATCSNGESKFKLYLNDSLVDNDTIFAGNIYDDQPLYIGVRDSDQYFHGRIDEVRISNIARNQSWINGSFHTSNRSENFIVWGSEELTSLMSISDVYPPNDGTSIPLNPAFQVQINHSGGIPMNVTWYSNTSGSWASFGTNNTVTNGTYQQRNVDVNEREKYYFWNFTVNDGNDTYESGILSFQSQPDFIPGNPTTVNATLNTDGSLNITWTNDDEADAVTVISRNDTYPSSFGDGWVRQNMSRDWYNDTTISGARYFTLYSYNKTNGSKWSSGYQVSWGGLGMSCFNESSGVAIGFDIEITNEDASTTYSATSLTNIHYLDMTEIPYGDNTIFIVSSSGYKDRTYYYDLVVNQYYNFSFYLPVATTDIHMYYFQVIDGFDVPVQDATVNISVKVGNTYEMITQLITDSNGQNSLFLNSSKIYQVKISKNGYETETAKWIPDPNNYGIYYPKYFRLLMGSIDAEPTYTFWDLITFNATMYDNNTIRVMYLDSNTSTNNAQFSVFEMFNLSQTLVTRKTMGDNIYSFWVSGINISRQYKVQIHLNHSTLEYVIQSITVNPIATDYYTDITAKLGAVGFGWEKLDITILLFVFIPAIVILFIGAKGSRVGLGAIGCGLWIGFIGYFFQIPTEGIALTPLIVAIGMFLEYKKGGKTNL